MSCKFIPVFALISVFVMISASLFSQLANIPTDSYKERYPDEDVIVVSHKRYFTFETDRSGKLEAIAESCTRKFVALEDDVVAVDARYYDSHSKIVKDRVTGSGQFYEGSSRRCGFYEIDGIFYHDLKMCQYLLEFEEEGQYLSVWTEKEFSDPKYFSRINLNLPWWTAEGKVWLTIPRNIDLEIIEMNFEGYEVTRGSKVDTDEDVHIIEYQFRNIPGYHDLENLPSSSCIDPHLLIVVKGYVTDEGRVDILSSTDDLYQWYESLVREPKLLPDLAKLTEEITAGASDDWKRIENVVYWIQDKIRYVAFADGIAGNQPEEPNTTFRNKYGDCKAMANLAKGMLLHLGLDARLCWVYSGQSCYDRDIPALAVDNHMICAIVMEDTIVYVDPTLVYSTMGEIGEGIQGKECLVEDGDDFFIGKVPDKAYFENFIGIENRVELLGDTLMTKGRITMEGAKRREFQLFRNMLGPQEEKLLRYFVSSADNSLKIKELSVPPRDSVCSRFEIDYVMKAANNVLDLGDELLLELDYYQGYRDWKIDTTRKYDFAFDSRGVTEQNIQLVIPEDMEVTGYPEPLLIDRPGYTFSAEYAVHDTLLSYRKMLAIKDIVLKKEDFIDWNEDIDRLRDFYNEMIILRNK